MRRWGGGGGASIFACHSEQHQHRAVQDITCHCGQRLHDTTAQQQTLRVVSAFNVRPHPGSHTDVLLHKMLELEEVQQCVLACSS